MQVCGAVLILPAERRHRRRRRTGKTPDQLRRRRQRRRSCTCCTRRTLRPATVATGRYDLGRRRPSAPGPRSTGVCRPGDADADAADDAAAVGW